MNSTSPSSSVLDQQTLVDFAGHIIQLQQHLSIRYRDAQPSVPELGIGLYVHMTQSDKKRHEQTLQRRRERRQQQHRFQSHNMNSMDSLSTSTSMTSTLTTVAPGLSCLSISGNSNNNASSCSSFSSKPTRFELERYLQIANAAYATTTYELSRNVRRLNHILHNFDGGNEGLISCRVQSDTFAPAYFVMFEHITQTLIVCIRGSFETADMITDIAADSVPFLEDGLYAHGGVAKSAMNLHSILRPILEAELTRRNPRGGLIVTGHSLGAACASALTMLLKRDTNYYNNNNNNNDSTARTTVGGGGISKAHLQRTRCYAYGPPPFLHISNRRKLQNGLNMNEDRWILSEGIVCIVNGWDFISRCCINSIHRLVHTCATLDYSPTTQHITRQMASGAANMVMSEEEADGVGDFVANLTANIRASDVTQGIRFASQATGSKWPILSNVLYAVNELVAPTVEQHEYRRRAINNDSNNSSTSSGNNRSRNIGNSSRNSSSSSSSSSNSRRRTGIRNDAGGEDDEARGRHGFYRNDEGEMVLIGEIWHLERDFTYPYDNEIQFQQQAGHSQQSLQLERGHREEQAMSRSVDGVGVVGSNEDAVQLPKSRLVRREADYFKDIEMSVWMKYDHFSTSMLTAIRTLRR